MKRREFITLLGGATAWPLAARAQQPAGRVYRVGYLGIVSREQALPFVNVFEEGLRSLGYRVGENVAIEYRSANGELEGLPALAAELAQLSQLARQNDNFREFCGEKASRINVWVSGI